MTQPRPYRVFTSFVFPVLILASFSQACGRCESDDGHGLPPVNDPSRATAVPEGTPAEVPPIAERCAEAAAQAGEVLGEIAETETAEPFRSCIGEAGGAWMFMPSSATSEEREGPDPYGLGEPGEVTRGTATTIEYRVTYLSPDGETYEEGRTRTASRDTYDSSSQSVRVKLNFDYDGDGNQELLLLFTDFVFEESEHEFVFWTFRDGAIREYAPADGIDVFELVDHDGDGRMDIVSGGVFYPASPTGGNDDTVYGAPEVLFHSLPDGTFSSSDEVAAAFLRQKCPAPPSVIFDENRDYLGERAVACARIWGASPAAIDALVAAELDEVDEDMRTYVRDSLRARARVEPPLTLTPSGRSPWHCLCYREADQSGAVRDNTACRRSAAPCAALERRAETGAGRMDSLISACRLVGEAEHPQELLGPAAWEPSSRAGAWWVPGACVMR